MRPRLAASAAALALLAFRSAACAPTASDRTAASNAERAAELAHDPELADPLGQALRARAQKSAAGWLKHDHVLRGTLPERGRQAFLSVLPVGHCYRYLAVSEATVSDLDLALFDANNVEILRDVTEDPSPDLGVAASVCPGEPTQGRLEVRMRRGHGAFAIGVFRSE